MFVTMPARPIFSRMPIAQLLKANRSPSSCRSAATDGVSFDPLRRHIVENDLPGLIVEPVPLYFDKLKALYAGSAKVRPINCAVAEENGERTIWGFNPLAVERGLLPPHFGGIVSFVMEDLLNNGILAASAPDEETMKVLRSQVCGVAVQCRTLETLLAEQKVERVDILQIDTEGYDYVVLKLFDFARYQPAIIHYEHQHLSEADAKAAEALLKSHGYRFKRNTFDTLAVRGESQAAGLQVDALRDLAVALAGEGRTRDALMLLEHLESLQFDDAETLKQLVKVLGSQGQTRKALEKLVVLKSLWRKPPKSLVGRHPRTICLQRSKAYNVFLPAINRQGAADFLGVLADVILAMPGVLNSALTFNLAIGRKRCCGAVCVAALAIDRNHAGARAVLVDPYR
jgi:FkbM family methyltransferase